MALLENCRVEIAEYNGLNLLIDFLMETPFSYTVNEKGDIKSSESELSACERVLQKAAIAISRFCREPKYSILLVELGVIPRLSNLCRDPNERNNSDSVLVACLVSQWNCSHNCLQYDLIRWLFNRLHLGKWPLHVMPLNCWRMTSRTSLNLV